MSWFVRENDIYAYREVAHIETLLRRIIRWELRGTYGEAWYAQLQNYHNCIDQNIESERNADAYDQTCSELSFLDLAQLLQIIFRDFWPIYSRVFESRRGLKTVAFRTLLPVRHKVAHFRAVRVKELHLLSEAQSLIDALHFHYSKLQAVAYLSGNPELADMQIDPHEVNELLASLKNYNLSEVWDEYQLLEPMRALGLYPGIGVLEHHVFYEIYIRGSFLGKPIIDWLEKVEDKVTFLNINSSASYLRIFIPIVLQSKAIRKLMRGIAGVAKKYQTNPKPPDIICTDFDVGRLEALGCEGKNINFNFAF